MATAVAQNLDLLTEILLRLPVKPLLRFKCVSKQWRSLISNPQFCHSHVLRQYQAPHPFPSALLVDPKHETCANWPIMPLKDSDGDQSALRVLNLDFLNVPHLVISIIQSCNGLLLVQGHPSEESPDERDRPWPDAVSASYFVCNPTTKQFFSFTLPPPEFFYMTTQLFLEFNPLRSLHYKVILFRCKFWVDNVNRISKYSSETGSWNEVGVCFPNLDLSARGIYCNGAIHWFKAEKSFYFDMEDECFKTLPMPLNTDMRMFEYFGESGGHLHIILRSFQNVTELGLNIFVLNGDYSGWSLRFHVALDHLPAAFTDLNYDIMEVVQSIQVLSIVCQEKEEGSVIVLFRDCKVMSYNLVNSTCRELSLFYPLSKPLVNEPIHVWLNYGEVFQYFENLSWVGASTAYQHES